MALPFLPGYAPNPNLGKEKFNKPQHCTRLNGVDMLHPLSRPHCVSHKEEMYAKRTIKPKYSLYPKGTRPNQPSWVAFDKLVLNFDAYLCEVVPEAQEEEFRIRKCNIYFFLEDDTIRVVEPVSKNSGLHQGTLIRRQRIPLPPPNQEDFYHIYNFNINQKIEFFSRIFTITDCDLFTKNFLLNLGVRVNEPCTPPDDPFSVRRKELEDRMKPIPASGKSFVKKKPPHHEGKVLRFFCIWEDPLDSPMNTEPRELTLYYFLDDDTVTITETIPAANGLTIVSKFLRRSKLPKHAPAQMKQPGQVTDRSVLNVLASENQGERFMLDKNEGDDFVEEFYKDSDLVVGGKVNVWGRELILTNCDEATKNFYRSEYGTKDFHPVEYKAPPAPRPPTPVPPYTGFGSEEDSLRSCESIILKPPKKDFRKFMKNDGLVMNFQARLVTSHPKDSERLFLISFYLCDDSMCVFELEQRELDILSSTLQSRGRVKKPGQELFKSEPSVYFSAQDLYVGAILCINSRTFHLLSTDERTMSYMEQHAKEFPKADMDFIFQKLLSIPEDKQKEIRKFLVFSDPNNTSLVQYDPFRNLMLGLDIGLSEHEVLVLARCFSLKPKDPEEDPCKMLAVAKDILTKHHFQDFVDMARVFAHQDKAKEGCLSVKDTRNICKAMKLPVTGNLLEALLCKFADPVTDTIAYSNFIDGLNYLQHPEPSVLPEDIFKYEVDKKPDQRTVRPININYMVLLEKMGLNVDMQDLRKHPASMI